MTKSLCRKRTCYRETLWWEGCIRHVLLVGRRRASQLAPCQCPNLVARQGCQAQTGIELGRLLLRALEQHTDGDNKGNDDSAYDLLWVWSLSTPTLPQSLSSVLTAESAASAWPRLAPHQLGVWVRPSWDSPYTRTGTCSGLTPATPC